MDRITTLADLGTRICIMGPSNSGKSTLAAAIGRARGLPVVHLDRLRHLPGTDWRPRPEVEFIALHAAAIAAPCWVMEGNYSQLLPPRLQRATGYILLDVAMMISLLRYLRRSWLARERTGALEGGRDSVKWGMIRHILITTQANRKRYRLMFERLPLPKVALDGPGELRHFYDSAGLER